MISLSCEFCDELRGGCANAFAESYGHVLASRIVRAADGFVALPTLGQIFSPSFLVLPTSHVETLADLDPRDRQRCYEFAKTVRHELLSRQINVALFEHGARALEGSGCGIYHAHLHVVPLPTPVDHSILLPGGAMTEELTEAWRNLIGAREYLVFEDSSGCCYLADPAGGAFPSQYFRRRLAEIFGRYEWDWRRFEQPEASVISAVQAAQEAQLASANGRS